MFQGPIAVYSDDAAAVAPLLIALQNHGLDAEWLDADAPDYDPASDGDRYSLVLSCLSAASWRRGKEFMVASSRYLERLEDYEVAVVPSSVIGWPVQGEPAQPVVRAVESRWASRAA